MAETIHFEFEGDLMYAEVEFVPEKAAYFVFDFHNTTDPYQDHGLTSLLIVPEETEQVVKWINVEGATTEICETIGNAIEYYIINKMSLNGEEAFVIEIGDTSFIIQEFLVDSCLIFTTTINGKDIRFEPDEESGNLKADFYPIDVDRDIIDAIADGIEKYLL